MASVLIVEDEGILAFATRMLLEDMGHDVLGVVDNAEDALRLARTTKPDLALLDIVIKGDIDGIALGEILASELGCEIIFITGSSRTHDERIGQGELLKKPLGVNELRSAINNVLSTG